MLILRAFYELLLSHSTTREPLGSRKRVRADAVPAIILCIKPSNTPYARSHSDARLPHSFGPHAKKIIHKNLWLSDERVRLGQNGRRTKCL